MRGKNMQQREVTQYLSASFTACTEGTHQHFTHCMHTLTHKEYIYIYIYTSIFTTTHTPPRRVRTANPQLRESLTGHKSDPDGLMVDL